MRQRHEHLARAQLFAAHVVLHDRVAARELMLVSEPIEDPLRRMPLLGRTSLILVQNRIDHTDPRIKLWTPDRLLPPIARRRRKRHHLPNRLARDPKLPRRCPLAHPLNQHRPSNTTVKLHLVHPSGVPQGSQSRQLPAEPLSGVDYFYTAKKPRSLGATWSIFAPALIPLPFWRAVRTEIRIHNLRTPYLHHIYEF